jgi:hypothetical protein
VSACATRCVSLPRRSHCAPQTHRYADGLRAALAICDRVEANHDDVEAIDEVRWYLRRALSERDVCGPAPEEIADDAPT